MAIPVTIEIAANKDATVWTNLSSKIRRSSIRMGGQAETGVAGSGFGFDFEDPLAAFALPARRVVRLTVGDPFDTVIARGRVTDKGIQRMNPGVQDARQFNVNLNDANAHLQGIPVHRWSRPAETDVERIQALLDTFLSGDPRPSTALFDWFLSTSDPVDLEAYVYDTTNPAGVVSHIRGIAGKLFFVTHDDAVYYDAEDSTAYACAIVVTDATDADPSLGEFNPIWTGTPGTQDGSEFYSGLHVSHGDDLETEHVTDAVAEAAHDFWEEVVNSSSSSSDDAQATLEAESLVAERAIEEERFSFAVEMDDDYFSPSLLFYGGTFSFRAAAAGVTSPRIVRASRVVWSMPRLGRWRADVEAGFPKKVAARLSRGGGPTNPSIPVDGDSDQYTVCDGLSGYPGAWTVGSTPPADPPGGFVNDTIAIGDTIQFIPTAAGAIAAPEIYLGGANYTLDTELPMGVTARGILSGRFSIPSLGANEEILLDFEADNPADLGATGFTNIPISATAAHGSISGQDIPDDDTYFFKWELGAAVNRMKIWPVSMSEPGTWGITTTDYQPVVAVFSLIFQFSAISSGGQPYTVLVDQLTWCYTLERGTAYRGASYGPTLIGYADGATSAFTLPAYPGAAYIPGSLSVYVDGVWQPVTETDPAAGEFDLGWDPADDDVISASWRVPS